MRIIFVRHGEPNYKLDCLTELGKLQAERCAEALKNERIDVIYSSDLSRAFETAIPVAKAHGLTVIPHKGLREIFAGEWENLLFDEIEATYPDTWRVWREDIGNACPTNGESTVDLQSRVVNAICHLAERHEGKTLFLFSHATPIRTFSAYVLGKTQDEIKELPWAPNASVTKVTFDCAEKTFSMIEYGRDDFMGEMSTHLPSNV